MKRRAFTLVELLVVIGIIAVLIAFLLPTLSAANDQSKTVQCLSNLRQLSLAAEQYCNASGGYYPIAYYADYRPPLSTSYQWDFTTITNVVSGQVTVEPGLLWPGMRAAPVQQCPAFDGASNTLSNPYTGYNYNVSYIGGGSFGSAVFAPAKAATIRVGWRCALFGDGQYYNGGEKFMHSPTAGPADVFFGFKSAASGTQGFRHRGKTNVVFCDGHAESLGERYITTSDSHPVGAGTGFLSADNSFYNGQ